MPKKIFLIDDDPAILDATRLILEDTGYNVMTSTRDGKELHDGLNVQPDLVILDMLLSGRDGREICRELKQKKDTRDIPILMISAHPDAKKSAIKAGADDFIAKPFDMNDLLKKIERQMR